MISKWLSIVLLGLMCCGYAMHQIDDSDLDVEWVDDFSPKEKTQLVDWLNGVLGAVNEVLGPYPFPMNIYVHRSDAMANQCLGHTLFATVNREYIFT